MKNKCIVVQGAEISIATRYEQDYISLTDMVKHFEGGSALIEQWLKNKDTILFLGVWEQLNNPAFNSPEFEGISHAAGRNSFFLSAKKWTEATGAIGLHAKTGRYGGTYAHRDIAFEFGSWLSPEFKLYLIKEFQRLKDYASEADLLNVALFGMTAMQWRLSNADRSGNMRDSATLEQLVVLSNLESINAVLIHQGIAPAERLTQLNAIAITQMRSLVGNHTLQQLPATRKKLK